MFPASNIKSTLFFFFWENGKYINFKNDLQGGVPPYTSGSYHLHWIAEKTKTFLGWSNYGANLRQYTINSMMLRLKNSKVANVPQLPKGDAKPNFPRGM